MSIERARVEAARLGANVEFGVADFRDLDDVSGEFDVVISCDNALPHLLDDNDLLKALRSMRSKLRPGGLLLISTRDFDKALVDRPSSPVTQAGPRVVYARRIGGWSARYLCRAR
jgi:2-polyprenyl-3-methyl-5-hydroxy-6-metoxy-1,4-benzoquinol methylase